MDYPRHRHDCYADHDHDTQFDASCCDHQRIKTLEAKLAAAEATLEQAREIFAEIRGQWGDDYLWKKWHLDEDIASLEAGKEAGG